MKATTHKIAHAAIGRVLGSIVSALLLLAGSVCVQAQTGTTTPPPANTSSTPGEVTFSNYVVHQSIEVGGRISDQTGSGTMYDTLVNLQSGFRVLDQSLSMRSTLHEGQLFDDLFISSFGWNGDPNNAMRARVSKAGWYDFRGQFRRDQNFFDYNLLANPLNPSTSSPTVLVNDSPHRFETRRRMYDFDLTLLPHSWISFRLGYSRNNMTGPSYSSVHEGTDVDLFQNWNTTLDTYRAGVDFNVLPRTVFSFDETLNYYKGDTNYQLQPFFQANVPGSGPVELGLPVNTLGNQPCGVTAPATSLVDSSGNLTNLGCNAFFTDNRAQRIRTSTPVERVSARSNYFNFLDLTASWSYSSGDMTAPLNEFFNGLVSRSFIRQFTVTGPATAHEITNGADFTATVHLSHGLRIVDTLWYWGYRIPQSATFSETDWKIPGLKDCKDPTTCSLTIPISATVPTTTVTTDLFSFNQKQLRNQTELVWDFSKEFGVRGGFRYGHRHYFRVNDFASADIDDLPISEHTGLFAFWARPTNSIRFNFDYEYSAYVPDSNGAYVVRTAPGSEARYRVRGSYTPRKWAVLSGNVNIIEAQNNNFEGVAINYRNHSRNYGFNASLNPRERVSFDLAYNYTDFMQSTFICFADSNASLPVVSGAGDCSAVDEDNVHSTYGYYQNNTHFGMADISVRPIKRVTTRFGYSITSVGGKTPQFNVLQPLGSLSYNYHQPLAGIDVDLIHNVSAHGGWNYYQYGEKDFVGPTQPRYFHANNVTLSLRYAF